MSTPTRGRCHPVSATGATTRGRPGTTPTTWRGAGENRQGCSDSRRPVAPTEGGAVSALQRRLAGGVAKFVTMAVAGYVFVAVINAFWGTP